MILRFNKKLLKIIKTGFKMRNIVVLSILTACNSKQAIENAECSDAEQGMFIACIEAGCSAEYTQSLEGNDACSVEGSGSYVSVGAGGECGFSSSGSCYVVCDCPDGLSVTYEVEDDTGVINDPGASPDSMKPEDITGYELRAILSKIDDVKTSCNQSVDLLNQKLEEKDAQIQELQTKITTLEAQDGAIYTYVDSNISLVQWGFQSEIDTLVQSDTDIKTSISDISNQITSINDTLADQQDQLDELYSSIGLIVSQYDVDCSRNNLSWGGAHYAYSSGGAWVFTDTYTASMAYMTVYGMVTQDCVLVEGVSSSDFPMVQVYKDDESSITDFYNYPSQTTWSYTNNWGAGTSDGGYLYGSGPTLFYGPGFQVRYDSSLEIIYTAPHYVSNSMDKTARTYHVVVIGTKEYTAP